MAENMHNLWMGISVAAQPYNFLVAMIGLSLGVIVGVLPGLGGANGVAILIPLTVAMDPIGGHHPSGEHLLGISVRWKHHVHPLQHPRRAMVGGGHIRRISNGA